MLGTKQKLIGFEDIDSRCVGKLKAKVFDRVLFLPVKRSLVDDN